MADDKEIADYFFLRCRFLKMSNQCQVLEPTFPPLRNMVSIFVEGSIPRSEESTFLSRHTEEMEGKDDLDKENMGHFQA